MTDGAGLVALLTLEPLETNLFRGQSEDIGSPQVFGGQVLGQALAAAQGTVDDAFCAHSLHAYFILPGDFHKPIVYHVDMTRDGGSFVTRRVRAIQNGRDIFILSASFQVEQAGHDHQIDMPDVPGPDTLRPVEDILAEYAAAWPEGARRHLLRSRPIEFRASHVNDPFNPQSEAPYSNIWLRSKIDLGDNHAFHQCVLAYASDYNLLMTALNPHAEKANLRNTKIASLDHAMWFHRPFRADQWLLYAMDSPSASGARGFCRGSLFDEQGRLVASVVQEGLLRPR
ncbi:MAG: acyl-CoA thioesterase II [Pseudomonadota bacterium]